MKLSKITYILISLIAIVYILTSSKNLLIPFVLALIIWFLVKEVKRFVRKASFAKGKVPEWLQNTISFSILFLFLGFIVKMCIVNIQDLYGELPKYEEHLRAMNEQIRSDFDIDIAYWVSDFSGSYDFSSILTLLLNSLTNLFGDAFMVIIYVLFIMLEESIFKPKLQAAYRDNERFQNINVLLNKIDKSISNYISLKTVVSLSTGILSGIALWIIGVDFPVFWAFLIFLLNYIPTIGSLIATLFPVVIAVLDFGSFMPGLYVLLSVGAIQILIGNIIEPRIMGNSLNISPLIVILALTFWGSIWGIVGMVLSVPITVMMIIVMAQFEETKGIAILLSREGKLYEDQKA